MDLSVKLNNLMLKYKFKPEKRLGQNFIVNQDIIAKAIKHAKLNSSDYVLEIGAGTGFLTTELLKKSNVIAIEIDEKLFIMLENELKSYIKEGRLSLLKCDFREKINSLNFNKVVSFPAYYLSKELIESLLLSKAELIVLVMQNEFAEKLVALPGFDDYVTISVLAQYFFSIELKERIPRDSFYPQPKSDSRIIVLKRLERKKTARNEKKFIEFINELFRYKNKNALNGLKKVMEKFPEINKEKINEFKKKNEKIMLLEVDELIELFNLLFS